jgi:hypothetical protein
MLGRNGCRRGLTTGLVGGLAMVAAVIPSVAAASGATYTLDGKAASAQAVKTAGACAAIADAHGVVACFSTEGGLLRAQADALRSNEVPPGWGIVPTDASRETLAARLDAEASGGGGTVQPYNAGSFCFGYTNIHIWQAAGFSGTAGSIGPTGGWYDLQGGWSNSISSYRNSDYYTSWFSDYSLGSGATYGAIARCWWNDNLSTATMSDGGTANDRFSSAWVGG